MNFAITELDSEGNEKLAVELTEKEYVEMMRAMQWPEDLEKFDRINSAVVYVL
jgi:hypothetical protein